MYNSKVKTFSKSVFVKPRIRVVKRCCNFSHAYFAKHSRETCSCSGKSRWLVFIIQNLHLLSCNIHLLWQTGSIKRWMWLFLISPLLLDGNSIEFSSDITDYSMLSISDIGISLSCIEYAIKKKISVLS